MFSSSDNNTVRQTVPEITPRELVGALEAGDQLQILDVRVQTEATPGGAGSLPEERILNIPGSQLLAHADLAGTGIDPALPVVVICGHGNDSKVVAMHLNRLGAHALSLKGGMAEWMMLSVPRVLVAPPSLDRLVQFDRVGKEALSYVLISDGEAMIIDPPRDSLPHLRYIEESGATPVAVADTHVHADYISGGPRIARELRIPYFLHPADRVFPYDGTLGQLNITAVYDGMTIRVGRCKVASLHTPGHSPGSVTYLVGNDAAFTGDFLFLTSIGRPDLADRTEEWAAMLWKSIRRAKGAWPPQLMIYPAHYTSRTPRSSGGAIRDSFDHVLRNNAALRMTEESEFLHWIRSNVTTAPPAYRTIKGVNVGLLTVEEQEAELLENGKNECAVEAR